MTSEQHARASGNARITQIAGDQVNYAPGAGPVPRAGLGLPEAPPVLVGRDGPAEELLSLLADGGPTVAVVAGLAGVGKSALAVAAAHRAAELDWFGDRVFFLRLRGYAAGGGVSGPDAVREMLGQLGIREADMPQSEDGRAALYRGLLAECARAGQRVLIVADDAGEVAQVRDLVPANPGHRLLITSRHRLVHRDFSVRVVALDELAPDPAAELLARAVLRTWPQDPRPAAEPEAFTEVAEQCGRLPLALTVAGALLAGDPGLPVTRLAAQLADARTRLAKLDSELDDGVRAAFDLSYGRLPADQARVFRLLTVNPGPDCAMAYAALLTGEEAADLRPKLAALVRASLLAEEPVGSGRWRMHDLVRLYARERGEECAAEDGREEAVDALLGSLVLDVGKATGAVGVNGAPVAPGPGLPSVAQALDWLDGERAMLVAAVGFAGDAGRPAVAMELGTTLIPYLQIYRYRQDAVLVAQRMLAAAERTGHPEDIGARLYDLALAYAGAEQLDGATASLVRALEVFRVNSLRMGEGKALNTLGTVHMRREQWAEAERCLREALKIFRELGIRHGKGTVLASLAEVFERTGRLEEAVSLHRQAVSIMGGLGDFHREAAALNSLADALWLTGRHEESLAAREQALATQREFGNRRQAAGTLKRLADALRALDRDQEAEARYEEALVVFEETTELYPQAQILNDLALVRGRGGRWEEAREGHERAGLLFAACGDRAEEEAAALVGLGFALYALDRPAEAADALERGADLYAAIGDTAQETTARGAAAELRGQPDPPRRRWRRGGGGYPQAGDEP
ncbi:ATP-binding protein [Streptomyces sp. NPDC004126]|uniref:ATP-binding protein n=1 Tax=Streptomyces sp. NPDC004126 TaxID=3390695 RepID=UPI003CFC921E